MTHAYKIFFCFFIIIALVCVSSPLYFSEDVNFDQSIDLKDVIQSAKQMADSSTDTASVGFAKHFKNFYASAQCVAGFKTVIKKNDQTDAGISISQVFLLPSDDPIALTGAFVPLDTPSFLFTSLEHGPSPPPPLV